MNQLIPASRRNIECAAWGLVLVVLAHLCWLQARPDSECRRLYAALTKSEAFRIMVAQYERLDRIPVEASDGNMVLQLTGEAKTNPHVENFLSSLYFRSSYAAYPRRVYVAPANVIINDGGDIVKAGFNPDPPWLQAQDVHFRLIFGNDEPGREMHLQILPVTNGQNETPATRTGGK